MVVVADTSPINYLVLIGQIDLLAQLYTQILIPPAVLAELKHYVAPKPVRDWADSTPKWIEVLSPMSDPILAELDLGESEAIALATELNAEVVLIDERAGRQEALRRGLKVAGTLSVLDEADQAGLPKSIQKPSTVTKPHQLGLTVSKPGRSSFAFRFNFCRARPLHLQFHLRVLLKHLRVALP